MLFATNSGKISTNLLLKNYFQHFGPPQPVLVALGLPYFWLRHSGSSKMSTTLRDIFSVKEVNKERSMGALEFVDLTTTTMTTSLGLFINV